jgi:CDP-diacylglycerol--serine O-phosphatidyltransferase
MICGILAIISTLVIGKMEYAFALIILAAVFDFFDGLVARALHQSSPLGVQLDSLSDVVSFGVAPAVMMLRMWKISPAIWDMSDMWGYCVLAVAAFSSLRLAKFNIDDSQSTDFEGLATPANAILLGAIGVLVERGEWVICREALLVLTVLSCFLLVCPIRMFSFKFKGLGWSENKVKYIFLLSAIVLVSVFGIKGVVWTMALYVVLSTNLHFVKIIRK